METEIRDQQILELVYGLLDEADAVQLRARIDADAELRHRLEAMKSASKMFAEAARLRTDPVSLVVPSGSEVNDSQIADSGSYTRNFTVPKTGRRARAFWPGLISLAAAIVVGFLGLDAKRAIDARTAAIGGGVLTLRATSPHALQPGVAADALVWCESADGRKHDVDLKLALIDATGDRLGESILQVQTNGDVPVRAALPADAPGKTAAAVALNIEAATDKGIEKIVTPLTPAKSLPNVVASSDRPTYAPGDTVHLRTLSLDRTQIAAVDVPSVMTIAGPVTRHTLPDSPVKQGVQANSWKIPDDASSGKYSIHSQTAATSPSKPAGEFHILPKPQSPSPFQLDLEFLRESYSPGERVVAQMAVKGPTGEALAATASSSALSARGQAIDTTTRSAGYGKFEVDFTLPPDSLRAPSTLATTVSFAGQSQTLVREVPGTPAAPTIDLYPEGGGLVEGVPNRVFFVATGPNRKPVHATGELLVEGKSVANLESRRDGMGHFQWTPRRNEKSAVVVNGVSKSLGESPDQWQEVSLSIQPAVFDAGGSLAISVLSSPIPHSILLTASVGGLQVAQQFVKTTGTITQATMTLPQDVFGVMRITAFAIDQSLTKETLTPLAERLVFRRPAKSLNVQLADASDRYSPGETVRFGLRVQDEKRRAAKSVLGVAVVDESALMGRDRPTPDLLTQFWLTNVLDPAVDVDNANFYLESNPDSMAALELLLGSHGWRRLRTTVGADADRGRMKPAEAVEVPTIVDNAARVRMLLDSQRFELQNCRSVQWRRIAWATGVGIGLSLLSFAWLAVGNRLTSLYTRSRKTFDRVALACLFLGLVAATVFVTRETLTRQKGVARNFEPTGAIAFGNPPATEGKEAAASESLPRRVEAASNKSDPVRDELRTQSRSGGAGGIAGGGGGGLGGGLPAGRPLGPSSALTVGEKSKEELAKQPAPNPAFDVAKLSQEKSDTSGTARQEPPGVRPGYKKDAGPPENSMPPSPAPAAIGRVAATPAEGQSKDNSSLVKPQLKSESRSLNAAVVAPVKPGVPPDSKNAKKSNAADQSASQVGASEFGFSRVQATGDSLIDSIRTGGLESKQRMPRESNSPMSAKRDADDKKSTGAAAVAPPTAATEAPHARTVRGKEPALRGSAAGRKVSAPGRPDAAKATPKLVADPADVLKETDVDKGRSDQRKVASLAKGKATAPTHFREYAYRRIDPTPTRTDFPKTIYWNPFLETDADGLTSIQFQLPDTVTSYRVRTIAHAPGRLGGGIEYIHAELPFSVEPLAPPRLRVGDRFTMPIRLVNRTREPMSVRIACRCGSGLKISQNLVDTFVVPANGWSHTGIALKAVAASARTTVDVAASAGEFTDSVRKQIAIEPQGITLERTLAGTVSRPAAILLDGPMKSKASRIDVAATIYPTIVSELKAAANSIEIEPGDSDQRSRFVAEIVAEAYDHLLRLRGVDPDLVRLAKEKSQGDAYGPAQNFAQNRRNSGVELAAAGPFSDSETERLARQILEFVQSGRLTNATPLIEKLVSLRSASGRFGSIRATYLSAMALSKFEKAVPRKPAPGKCELLVGGQTIAEVGWAANEVDALTIHKVATVIGEDFRELTLRSRDISDARMTLLASWRAESPTPKVGSTIEVDWPRTDWQEKSIQRVNVRVSNATANPSSELMLHFPIPSGATVQLGDRTTFARSQSVVVVDNRGADLVFAIGSLNPGEVRSISVPLLAEIPGQFVLPPTSLRQRGTATIVGLGKSATVAIQPKP